MRNRGRREWKVGPEEKDRRNFWYSNEMRGGVEALQEIGIGEPNVTYSEPGEYYFVTEISVSASGPGDNLCFINQVYYGRGSPTDYARRPGFGDSSGS